MVDGFVQDAVETTSGDIWYQAQSSDGRTYYVQQGEGYVTQQQYAAAKSHSLSSSVGERNMDVNDALDSIESMQGRGTVPMPGDNYGTIERDLGQDKNKMLGYINAKFDVETEQEMLEAIEDYSEFVKEINNASSSDRRQEIREAYGVGGS